MAAPKHRMTLEEYYQIINWLKENRHRIHASSDATQLEICKQAEESLGFNVPITSLQKCGRIAKIKWPKSPAPPLPVPIQREAIIILIGAISGLYVETNRTVPAELANLQTTYVQEPSVDNEVY